MVNKSKKQRRAQQIKTKKNSTNTSPSTIIEEKDLHGKKNTDPDIIELLQVLQSEESTEDLPNPQILAAYDAIVPGSANRILKQFELESEQTRFINKLSLESSIKEYKRGQWLLFSIVTIYGVISCFTTIYGGSSLSGSIIAVGALAVLVGGLLKRRK